MTIETVPRGGKVSDGDSAVVDERVDSFGEKPSEEAVVGSVKCIAS